MMDTSVFIGFLFGFAFGVAGGTFYYYYAVKKIKARYSKAKAVNVMNLPETQYNPMDFKTEYVYDKRVI